MAFSNAVHRVSRVFSTAPAIPHRHHLPVTYHSLPLPNLGTCTVNLNLAHVLASIHLPNHMPRKKAPLKFAALLTLPPHLQQIRDRYDMARQAAQARRKRYRKLRQVKSLMSPDSPALTTPPQQPPADAPEQRPAADAASSDQAAGGAETNSTTESEETPETYSGTDVDFSTDIFDDDSFFFAHNID